MLQGLTVELLTDHDITLAADLASGWSCLSPTRFPAFPMLYQQSFQLLPHFVTDLN